MGKITFICSIYFFIFSNCLARVPVKVGAYTWAPFLIDNLSDYGIVYDLVDEFNKVQEVYKFELVHIVNDDRYRKIRSGEVDLILFEDPTWEWQDMEVDMSDTLYHGGEVYLGNINLFKSRDDFKELKKKHISATRFYHYNLLGYETDQEKLSKKFKITLVKNIEDNIYNVLNKKADVALISISHLSWFLHRYPQYKKNLITAKNQDLHYNHVAVISKKGNISLKGFNKVLNLLKKENRLEQILQRYGLTYKAAK